MPKGGFWPHVLIGPVLFDDLSEGSNCEKPKIAHDYIIEMTRENTNYLMSPGNGVIQNNARSCTGIQQKRAEIIEGKLLLAPVSTSQARVMEKK